VRWPPDSSHHHTLGLYDSGEHDSRAHRLCKEPCCEPCRRLLGAALSARTSAGLVELEMA